MHAPATPCTTRSTWRVCARISRPWACRPSASEAPRAIARSLDDRVVWLSRAQKNAFAGNAIALATDRTWISARGTGSLDPDQLAEIERAGFRIGDIALDEIEKAGGSLRCCIAEIF